MRLPSTISSSTAPPRIWLSDPEAALYYTGNDRHPVIGGYILGPDPGRYCQRRREPLLMLTDQRMSIS